MAKCTLNACEVLDIISRQDDKDQATPGSAVGCTEPYLRQVDIRWRQLDRRLRAIEQPGKSYYLSSYRNTSQKTYPL